MHNRTLKRRFAAAEDYPIQESTAVREKFEDFVPGYPMI
jgi:hypothetical protein